MKNFKPKSLSEMNAEFAQKLAEKAAQEADKQQLIDEFAKKEPIDIPLSIQEEKPQEAKVEPEESKPEQEAEKQEAVQAQNSPSEETEEAVEKPAEQKDTTEKGFNLFEDVTLPIISRPAEKIEETDDAVSREKKIEEKIEEELRKEELTEPNPRGFFGPPIDKTKKKEKVEKKAAESKKEKPKIDELPGEEEPKFDFEKTLDYSGPKKRKSFKPRKKKSKGIKKLFNTVIIIVVILSVVVGVATFATARPGRFLFGYGLLICNQNVENTNIEEGALLFVKAAASAGEDEFVAVYKQDMTEYEIIPAVDISFQDTVFALATNRLPMVGKFLGIIANNWILCAVADVVLIITLIVIRAILFKNEKKLEIDDRSKRRRRKQKQILDF